MLPRIFPLLLLTVSTILAATFPPLEVETLAGTKLSLPAATRGNKALFVIGFTKDSQKQTEAWSKRLTKELPALELWSIADLEALPRLLRGIVVRAMRASVPKTMHNHFALVFKGGKALRQAVAYEARSPQNDEAWLVLVDDTGKVLWQFHGAPTDTVIAGLRERL